MMKDTTLLSLLVILLLLPVLVGCLDPTEHMISEERNPTEEQSISDRMTRNYELDMERFKAKMELTISINDRKINNLKRLVSVKRTDERRDMLEKLDQLEGQNNNMKASIHDYESSGIQNWYRFKDDFGKEMETLTYSLNVLVSNSN